MATKKNKQPLMQEDEQAITPPAEKSKKKEDKVDDITKRPEERKQPLAKKPAVKVEKNDPASNTIKAVKKAKPLAKKPVEERIEPIVPTKKITLKKKKEVIVQADNQEPAKKASKKIKPLLQTDDLTITFQLRFSSHPGQQLFITGTHDVLGSDEIATALPMQFFNHEFWYATINLTDVKKSNVITYRYFVKNADGTISIELGDDKKIQPSLISADELLVIDSWNYPGYYENTFYTEPFKQVLLKENFTDWQVTQPATYTHTFKVKAPLLPKNYVPCLSGSIVELGEWAPENVLPMSRKQNEDWFTLNIDFSNVTFPITYKYGVYDVVNKKLVRFEEGNNRVVYDVASAKKLTIVADGFIRLPNNTFKGAGISIPVFSLRSKNGLGVGEFFDLKNLVDWAKQAGLKLIQILPVNDTIATHTNADSYPYAAISAFALHPIYLHLPAIVSEENKTLLTGLEEIKQQLNNAESVNYIEVVKAKFDFVRKIFPSQKQSTFSTEDFNLFFTTNAHWLVPYAAFCYLRDEYGTADFTQWPAYSSFDVFEINELATPVLTVKDEISIHYFIQYNLHLQLKAATEYAHANGVIVKGDIPIGIFRNSCDAWQQPQLYHMDMQAGAPPDDFAIAGQNWGFPTYNWQRMGEDGFSWWKNRFGQMSYYFDAFRIDHILGFFRIWSIPLHAVEGVMGYFTPSIPVHINEFNERGIWFDHYRYTKPFINDAVLAEVFGPNAEQVKTGFVEKKLFDNYELLPTFDTQKKSRRSFCFA